MNTVNIFSTWIIFRNTKVAILAIRTRFVHGTSRRIRNFSLRRVLECFGRCDIIDILIYLLIVETTACGYRNLGSYNDRIFFFFGARIYTRELKRILDDRYFGKLGWVTTHWNFGIINFVEPRLICINNPDIHNRNWNIVHTRSHIFINFCIRLDVLFFETLGLAESSFVILGIHIGESRIPGVDNLKSYMSCVLKSNFNWRCTFWVHRTSINVNQNRVITWTFGGSTRRN